MPADGARLMEPAASPLALRWPARLRGDADQPVWLALVVALVLLITTGSRPGGETLAALFAVGVALAVCVRWRAAPVAIAVLVVVGVGLRAALQIHFGSDVLDVTAAAIRRMLEGANPYGIGYTSSRPAGAPYAYGPLALLWYVPIQDGAWLLETVVAGVILTLLALRGKLLGLAIYAVGPTLVATAGDGSNDTSAGFLLLLAFILARRRPVLGAVGLALAVAFKPYAAAWAPAYLVWGGWSVIGVFTVATVALWSPVLFAWGLPSFLRSLDLANRTHQVPYWSFGELWESFVHRGAPRELFDNLRLVLGAVTALVTLGWRHSLDGVILAGTVVYLVTLYMGFWSTYAYFGAIAPLLCWRIDDWLRLPTRPLVRLPGDEPERGADVSIPGLQSPDRKVAAT
jgi:hypothetical protein